MSPAPAPGADWLSRLPVIGKLPPDEAAAKLREIGEDDLADALAVSAGTAPETFGLLPDMRARRRRNYLDTAHAIGYLAPVSAPGTGLLPIYHAANIAADDTLKGARITLTLDGLRVADYPGRGVHQILFGFSADNQTDQGVEHLHFNATYRAAEGEQAAVLGRPIFTGLQVGGNGLFLKCGTVNVLNEDDEKLLTFLNDDAFKAGLQLLTIAQPALAPFSALAVGLTETIAGRSRNVAVQAVDLGLDFSHIAPRPRLAEGSYIAVQIPQRLRTAWHWENWGYDQASGSIVNVGQQDQLIPNNYLMVSISRYEGP
jgi:hypothetical protein